MTPHQHKLLMMRLKQLKLQNNRILIQILKEVLHLVWRLFYFSTINVLIELVNDESLSVITLNIKNPY
jgi:hypothetical protein